MSSASTNGNDDVIIPFFTQDGEYLTYVAKCSTVIPRITGTMSSIGSLMIIYVLISDRKHMLSKVKNRIIFGMSCIDSLTSLALAASTAPIPSGTPGVRDARGNTATCDAQGFLCQLGSAVPYYTCALSLYFLLVVRYKIKDEVISKRVEPLMHGFSVLFPLITAIIGVTFGLFNPVGPMCWFGAHPNLCGKTGEYECTRGSNSDKYILISGIPLGVAFSLIILFMAVLIYSVYSIEKTMEAHNFVSDAGTMHKSKNGKRRRTRETLNQALLYIGAYFVTYIFGFGIYMLSLNGKQPPSFLIILVLIFYPMQGFWNFFIFMWPRYILVDKAYPEQSFWMNCYQVMKVLDRRGLQMKAWQHSRKHHVNLRQHFVEH